MTTVDTTALSTALQSGAYFNSGSPMEVESLEATMTAFIGSVIEQRWKVGKYTPCFMCGHGTFGVLYEKILGRNCEPRAMHHLCAAERDSTARGSRLQPNRHHRKRRVNLPAR